MPSLASRLTTLALILSITTGVGAGYPFRLNQQYQTGDGYMRVRLLGAVEIPYERIKEFGVVELSGLAWDNDDEVLYALSDHGVVFDLHPTFLDGILTNVEVTDAFALTGPAGKPLIGQATDSEGLAIVHGRNGRKGDAELLVSFERVPRINRYSAGGQFMQRHDLPKTLQQTYRGTNDGFESVAFIESVGILSAPQYPINDPNGFEHVVFDLYGAAWTFPRFGAPSSSLTAIETMPDGSLITLERSYISWWHPLQIILRQSGPLPPPPGGALEMQEIVVFNSFSGWRMDNFEGLTRHRGNYFFLVSDDNANNLQRTLLVYLEIVPDPVTKNPSASRK